MAGWIKLHRQLQKNWVFADAEYLKAWIVVLLEVNHTPAKVPIKSQLFECGRGESLKSLDTWAGLFGGKWNKSKVRRFFAMLESDSMIRHTNETVTTRLSVCNYDDYQAEANADETQMKRIRNASETHPTPNKKEKKEKELKTTTTSESVLLFDSFWSMLPKKLGKKDCLAWWKKNCKTAAKAETIISGLENHLPLWEITDPQYIPHPRTWLFQERWPDEIIMPKGKETMEESEWT